jgi:transposase-like protein
LQIPKIRQGSYFPGFLAPRKRSEQALLSVVQQAYVCGVSTRRVGQLVESLGLRVSRSEVSRICAGLDEQVEVFRSRPLEGRYPYLFLDGKVEKVRDGGRVVRECVVIAHGVHESGRREIIGLDVGEAETEAFWTDFVRSLVARGLVGVQLVISDAHEGLKNAIAKVLGAPWQRCTVHFLRDCLGHARSDQHGPEAVATLEAKLPKVATMLEAAEDDILAFYAFPADHWRKDALDQPAGALQPRDRPAHRRRRDLPRRPKPDPPGLDARHRAKRRVAGRPALPIGRVDGAAPRGAAPSPHRRGGPRAPTGLSSPRPHRRTRAPSPTPLPGT